MRTPIAAALVLSFALAPCTASAQALFQKPLANQAIESIDPALKARIDSIAQQALDRTGVPSASIAVVQHGKLVYTHAYGLALLDPKTPATPAMRYSIGSISKQFTAAAILMLQEQGKLKLDDPVGKYVPGLTQGDKVTIRQVLSHTSGYQDYWPEDYVMPPMLHPETAQQILDTWGKKPLDFEPGAQWQYSNTNFVIAGRIVEAVSGRPLMDLLVERVFRPLNMTSVWNSDEQKLTSTDATPYYRHALGPLRPAPKEGRGWMFAAGELAMTPHDLALWDVSLIARSILSPESYNQFFTEIKLNNGQGSHYGLGVEVLDRNGHRVIEHSGEVSGFVSDNVVLVDDDAAIAVLTNQDAHGAASAIARQVTPLLVSLPAAAEDQALAIYRDLLQGRIDRSLLAPNLSDYFTPEALADYKASLAPLGEPASIRQTAKEDRGGMTFRGFELQFPSRRLRISTYTYPDGKLEQFLVEPVQ
ncbi:MAG: serine hydrolase [Terracidiphilus sp.]|nr:serine hydrolase [Terracidiphilus sp.]